MSFNSIINFLTKFIPYPDLGEKDTFVEWKNKLLIVLLGGMIIMGFIAYVPSVIFSLQQKIWPVAIMDTVVYAIILYTGFSKTLSSQKKVNIILTSFYSLGIALLYFLGPMGAGFNWLFVFPLLSSLFYGYRGILVATIINLVSLILLSIPIYFFVPEPGIIIGSSYDLGSWWINIVNFLVITTFISLSLSYIISNIEKSLKNERTMIEELKTNQTKLAYEKNRAEEADRLKSAFLANMSHEIRTPMNAILGFSELLGNPELTPKKFEEYFSLVSISGEQLLRIIDDIIDISKIELNQMRIIIQPVNINSCLSEVIQIQRNKIKTLHKNISIDFHRPDKRNEIIIETDENRLKQIINNLVGNAVKYTDSGKITVGYTINTEVENTHVEFFVKDTGRGIPENSFETIFDRFAQADNIAFKEGTGLGLSITKGLLQLLGGKIWLKSELQIGSEFYFTLPYNPQQDLSSVKFSDEKENKNLDLTGKLIYIAEDDESSYYFLTLLLEPTNVNIKQAENGKELLDLLQTEIPDLVLLDINMPVLNGFQTIQEIRKTLPNLPVIAQTAYAMPEEKQKCLDLGCNNFISKPIKASLLFKILAEYFN